jgi:hypothetical protein
MVDKHDFAHYQKSLDCYDTIKGYLTCKGLGAEVAERGVTATTIDLLEGLFSSLEPDWSTMRMGGGFDNGGGLPRAFDNAVPGCEDWE